MREEFLHFVWRTRNFDFTDLKTTTGNPVEILHFGYLNEGGGPDFKGGRIRIGETIWAGHIEMHLASSDWERHGHSEDPKYDNVILHVVLEDDQPVILNGYRIPCVELRQRIPGTLLGRYRRLIQLSTWVPCQNHLHDVQPVVRLHTVERMLVERLEYRYQHMRQTLAALEYDWDEVLFRHLCRSFGFKSNGPAFERLASLVPVRRIYQQGAQRLQVEALLFGTAGLLNRIFIDDYPVSLQREYLHLSRKYALTGMDHHLWEWGRLRPSNFPTTRISQLAGVLQHGQDLLGSIIRARHADEIRKLFEVRASEYWQDHTDFDKLSSTRQTRLGKQSVDRILVNSILPFMFTYGKHKNDQSMTDQAIEMMHQIPPESNRITRKWVALDMPHASAGHSQGLMHLRQTYCRQQRCVQCAIGNQILLTDNHRDV